MVAHPGHGSGAGPSAGGRGVPGNGQALAPRPAEVLARLAGEPGAGHRGRQAQASADHGPGLWACSFLKGRADPGGGHAAPWGGSRQMLDRRKDRSSEGPRVGDTPSAAARGARGAHGNLWWRTPRESARTGSRLGTPREWPCHFRRMT